MQGGAGQAPPRSKTSTRGRGIREAGCPAAKRAGTSPRATAGGAEADRLRSSLTRPVACRGAESNRDASNPDWNDGNSKFRQQWGEVKYSNKYLYYTMDHAVLTVLLPVFSLMPEGGLHGRIASHFLSLSRTISGRPAYGGQGLAANGWASAGPMHDVAPVGSGYQTAYRLNRGVRKRGTLYRRGPGAVSASMGPGALVEGAFTQRRCGNRCLFQGGGSPMHRLGIRSSARPFNFPVEIGKRGPSDYARTLCHGLVQCFQRDMAVAQPRTDRWQGSVAFVHHRLHRAAIGHRRRRHFLRDRLRRLAEGRGRLRLLLGARRRAGDRQFRSGVRGGDHACHIFSGKAPPLARSPARSAAMLCFCIVSSD